MKIGVFDSGIGGLTIVRSIKQLLPQESIVYFGDTAHLPYGDKSAATIQAYALRICNILLQKQCKVIVIACNSASAAAYEHIKAYMGKKAWVLNVIDPMIHYLQEHFRGKTIGLIGTKQTVRSGIYEKKIHALGQGIQLKALATPLLAPMIEDGFTQGKVCQEIIQDYLQDPQLQGISALILGCTHYPVIKTHIETFYQNQVAVLDATSLTAVALKKFLEAHQLINTQETTEDQFIVSDLTEDFEKATRLFFDKAVHLEQLPLWD
jgi:glutamate racemase